MPTGGRERPSMYETIRRLAVKEAVLEVLGTMLALAEMALFAILCCAC